MEPDTPLDLPRLRETLGIPALAGLIARIRRRLELGRSLTGTLTLREPRPEVRDAIERLLGRLPSRGSGLTVSLENLDARLRHAELCGGLAHAVELLTGPIVNLRNEQALLCEQWHRVFATVSEQIEQIEGHVELRQWLHSLRVSGVLKRIAGNIPDDAMALLNDALRVIARFPGRGIPLPRLAAETVGNSHALDANTRLGTLVIRAAAALGGVERWDDAETRRDAWAGVGVLCDELSAPVLVLNLEAEASTPTGIALGTYAAAGEPCLLTIRQLLQTPPIFHRGITGNVVFVCENPTVIAAAANLLGTKCLPIVCINGQPKTAARILLNRLREAGVKLAYHGDFDWPGIQIANLIMKRHGAVPLRMSCADYLAATLPFADKTASDQPKRSRLEGEPVTAIWDAGLTSAMLDHDQAIHEEQVLDLLLAELTRQPEAPRRG